MLVKLSRIFMAIVAATALLAVGCVDDESMEEVVKVDKADTNAEKHAFEVGKDGTVTFKAEIVYFHFDDYTLTEDGMARLDALADHLKKSPGQKLRIEGHCDERGSTEYNLALGQLRAQSVRKYLANRDVTEERLDAVSFGEERPATSGRTESAWAKNRRAEFKFLNI